MDPYVWICICRFWSLFMPRELMTFFYQNTLFLVLVTWAVFFFACKFHREFAFSKPMLIVFVLFVGIYSVTLFLDALQFIILLFPNEEQLVAFEITDNNTLFPLLPEEYYALDAGYYNAIEFETANRISSSIFLRWAIAVPAGIACIIYSILFTISLIRKHSEKTLAGGGCQ